MNRDASTEEERGGTGCCTHQGHDKGGFRGMKGKGIVEVDVCHQDRTLRKDRYSPQNAITGERGEGNRVTKREMSSTEVTVL